MDTFTHYLEITARAVENIFLIIGTVVTSGGMIEALFRRLPTKTPMTFAGFISTQFSRAAYRVRRMQPAFHALARFFADLDKACDNVIPQNLLVPTGTQDTQGSANRPDSPE